MLAAALLAAAGCQDSGGDGAVPAAGCGGKIAVFGAFTGANAGQVLPSLNGAKLAVKQFTAANPECKVIMQEFDTQGTAEQATPIATQVAQDQSFLAVIGGHFSGESKATTPIYEAAGLAMVSPSATATELTAGGSAPDEGASETARRRTDSRRLSSRTTLTLGGRTLFVVGARR